MRRIVAVIALLISLPASAAWKFNPHTGKLDYYEVAGAPADNTIGTAKIIDNTITPIKLKATGTPDNTMVPFWDPSGLFRWAAPSGSGTVTNVSPDNVSELSVATQTTTPVIALVGVPWAKLLNVPTTFAPASHNNTAHSVAFLTAADNAAGLSAQYTDWNASSGGASIANKPTLGTAAAKNIPAAGDASATEVIYGTDSRLTNARTPSSHNNTYHSETYLTTTGSAANLTSFPTLNQNTTGTAANVSGTPALPNGTTATTQAANDNGTKIATTAYVDQMYRYLTVNIDQPALTDNIIIAGPLFRTWTLDNIVVVIQDNTGKLSTASTDNVTFNVQYATSPAFSSTTNVYTSNVTPTGAAAYSGALNNTAPPSGGYIRIVFATVNMTNKKFYIQIRYKKL